MALDLHITGATTTGRVREHNEDAFVIAPHLRLAVVADGVGGYAAGEVAAHLAIEELVDFYERSGDASRPLPFGRNPDRSYAQDRLASAIRLANRRVYVEAHGDDAALHGMGTTLVAAAIEDDSITIGHVGDSRCYRLRAGVLEALTRDHSMFEELVQSMPELRARPFPYKNVITRAIGKDDDVEPTLRTEQVAPGDIYLLCSDGLSGMVPDAALAAMLARDDLLEVVLADLLVAANEAGGADNITAVLIAVHPGPG